MSDTVWVQLFLAFVVIAKLVFEERREIRQAAERQQLKEELHTNTAETIKGNKAAVEEAASAKEAAVKAAETSESIERKIEDGLNGGEAGLSSRVAKNETRLGNLEKWQESHGKALESQGKLLSGVARSMETMIIEFATFTKRFDKSHPSEDQTSETNR